MHISQFEAGHRSLKILPRFNARHVPSLISMLRFPAYAVMLLIPHLGPKAVAAIGYQ